MKDYSEFLESKKLLVPSVGLTDVIATDLSHYNLFGFQQALVLWAIKKGRAAIFADTGLGKTRMQLAWASEIHRRTMLNVLILAPLAVAQQTVAEGQRIGVTVHYVRNQSQVQPGINICNYEMLDHLSPDQFGGIVLDESSILKSQDSKTRQALIEAFRSTPYRLACTATPAPNDIAEIANHAEFLGIIGRRELYSTFFINACETIRHPNGSKTRTAKASWRLKNWAKAGPFWEWLSSWAMSVRKPSDLGPQYSDEGYCLPALNILPEFLKSDYVPKGQLFFTHLNGIQERTEVRNATLETRAARTVEIVRSRPEEQFIIWVDLNREDEYLAKLLPEAASIRGNQSAEEKTETLLRFIRGEVRVLITKTKIAGFGLNLQNCHNMIFCGLSDSWEAYYQAIRRCYRFGQPLPVNVWLVLADVQEPVYQNVMRKDQEARQLSAELIRYVADYEQAELGRGIIKEFNYMVRDDYGKGWHIMLGDSVERLKEVETGSVGLSVFSPPFSALYVYSNSERDLGNSRNLMEFMLHFRFVAKELRRAMMPGRIVAMHIQDIQATSVTHGERQCIDLSGAVIKMFQKQGFAYQGRIAVNKNPQTQASRNKIKELLFVTMRKDRTDLRPSYPDYVLIFKAPGENPQPVSGDFSEQEWIKLAHPCWNHIRETNVLNVAVARNDQDERHLCPLQLDLIEDIIKLYSNEGDLVLTPFLGIGSECYQAVKQNRRALGIELKPEYYNVALLNMQEAERLANQTDLFAFAGVGVA